MAPDFIDTAVKSMIRGLYNIRKNLSQLLLYGIIGCVAAGIDFIFFNILTSYAGLHYIVANCLSVLAGIFVSFILNRTLNFKVCDKIAVRFSLFFFCGMIGLFLSSAIMWVGVDKCQFSEMSTKIVSIFAVAFIQFNFNKFITFKKTL